MKRIDYTQWVGDRNPGIVVCAGGTASRSGTAELATRFGVSTFIPSQHSSTAPVESFVERLRAVWSGPVTLVGYVDFDPPGWGEVERLATLLEHRGVEIASWHYLVTPERFTEEELRRYRRLLRPSKPGLRQEVRDWVQRSGGISGSANGLRADRMPLERLMEAFWHEVGELLTPDEAQSRR